MKWLLLIIISALASTSNVKWLPWTEDLFTKAKQENRLVLLDLEAVWCHWCHVMEKETYGNAEVAKILEGKFLTVKVDQDARPDISRRYEDYGWPATIIFDSEGRELAKLTGFVPPDELLPILNKLVKDPKPLEPAPAVAKAVVASSSRLGPEQVKKLRALHLKQYDEQRGGFGFVHKFLFGDSEELLLRDAWLGDKVAEKRVKRTLKAALAILDPEWGGAYQYSVENWKSPHFEKIAESQYKSLYLYSMGNVLFRDASHARAVESVARYLRDFLRDPSGAHYTSQDADLQKGVHSAGYFKLKDAKRRKKGIPIIDKNIYSRENGWFAQGLLEAYAATANPGYLGEATQALGWIEKNRGLEGGGFRHGEKDSGGPFLGDTLEMGRAFLKAYEVTADRTWLEKARGAGEFILATFAGEAGFKTSRADIAPGLPSLPDRSENIRIARFGNLLSLYSGDKKFREMAETAMRYLLAPDRVEEMPTAGVLLADMELAEAPVHITIVGAKSDEKAKGLFLEALCFPTSYKRVEWYDKAEGVLPDSDVKYPDLSRPAAFACTSGRCSLPIFSAPEVRTRVSALYKK